MCRNLLVLILLALPLLAADDKTEIRRLDEIILKASTTHDPDTFIKYVAEDYRQVTRTGAFRDRKAAFDHIKNGPNAPADLKGEEVSLSMHGDSAILVRKQSWTNPAGKAMKGYLTDVFVKENSVWKLAGSFSTDIPSDAK